MPRRVDHEERRRQIADALLRTAATRGLHATGMREVAAEAGVSLRLVQYYFGTKEELMLFAMQHLAAQFAERGMARIRRLKETESPVSPRDVIAAILTEALPADDERRTFTVLYTAYFALSLTDRALAIGPLVRNSDAVTGVVAAQLRAAKAAGDAPACLDPDLEAVSLLAMSAGLGTSVLGGQSSAGQAQAVIDYHLHRLFPASRPALRQTDRYAGPAPGIFSESCMCFQLQSAHSQRPGSGSAQRIKVSWTPSSGVPVLGPKEAAARTRCTGRCWPGRSRWPGGRLIPGSAGAGSAWVRWLALGWAASSRLDRRRRFKRDRRRLRLAEGCLGC